MPIKNDGEAPCLTIILLLRILTLIRSDSGESVISIPSPSDSDIASKLPVANTLSPLRFCFQEQVRTADSGEEGERCEGGDTDGVVREAGHNNW